MSSPGFFVVGVTRPKSKCPLGWVLSGDPGGESTSKLTQVVGRIHFLVVVDLISHSLDSYQPGSTISPKGTSISSHVAPSIFKIAMAH